MHANENGDGGIRLRAEVVSYDDAPSECTLYPDDVPEAERTTTWITAQGDAFCPLTSWE